MDSNCCTTKTTCCSDIYCMHVSTIWVSLVPRRSCMVITKSAWEQGYIWVNIPRMMVFVREIPSCNQILFAKYNYKLSDIIINRNLCKSSTKVNLMSIHHMGLCGFAVRKHEVPREPILITKAKKISVLCADSSALHTSMHCLQQRVIVLL